MLDFLKIVQVVNKKTVEIHPKFVVGRSKDLMIRGGDFYAVWDEDAGLWSTDEYRALSMIDHELEVYLKEHKSEIDESIRVMYLWDADTGSIDRWHRFVKQQLSDNYKPLDEKLIFSNTKTTKEDYASKRLNYPLTKGDISAYDKLMSVLYNPDERTKIEWAIGAIVSGDSKHIQKFVVLYGSAGTGKSTILNIIQDLFNGYFSVFDAKALGSKSDSFALEPFSKNPLVSIQHDGDLSRIEDNTRLNSVVSHELMTVNEKFKSAYSARFNAFLFMGTNKPVKITDAKSGILRRLIDVSPSGKKVPISTYNQLMSQIKFELGAIASHCLEVYTDNPTMYDNYIPVGMLGASNDFYNFVLDSFDVFEKEDGVSLKQAWEMYKQYCQDSNVPFPYQMRIFREELKNYFDSFEERVWDGNDQLRNYYKGFKSNKFENVIVKHLKVNGIKFDEQPSIFDEEFAKCKAQYGSDQETPMFKWDNVKTRLCDLDTHKLHYVRLPKEHIVIDFDLKDKDGNKSFKKNVEAANKWPKTYAELSKSGQGIHLHYIYDGDVSRLARLYSEDIEIKVFNGKSSLRRKLTKCNNEPIAVINSALPLKEEVKVVDFDSIKNEKAIRTIIIKNLRKEYHADTKSSVDFIYKTLHDAYNQGVKYDVRDLRPDVQAFCLGSTHQSDNCIKLFRKMKFCSEDATENKAFEKDQIIFYDVEVLPNLFIVVWKPLGDSNKCVKMINPSPSDIENLIKFKLVGFNNRKYDNHILYGRLVGYDNQQLYELSRGIIEGDKKCMFREAYNLSYTDIFDFCSEKQTLKKWEIELGIHHKELGLPWDQPVDESMWETVADYCENDVIATEALWNARQGDFDARCMLSNITDSCVNDTTNTLTTKIIFGNEKHPKLECPDLSLEFPGYKFISAFESEDGKPHNMYRGEDVGFGGYVFAVPGMYGRTVTFDVASMHPHSILAMNCFGEYTERFRELVEARIAIKHKDYDKARTMLGGKLAPYLDDESKAKAVAQALKIAINSVYGLTSAKFDNPFRDPRNVNNIVALRGALFMVTLRDKIHELGGQVIHIKTDSIKVVDPTKEICDFIIGFGKEYGYTFEVEHIFEKICLVNNAVYIAKLANDDPDDPGKWTATGKQFQVPYVFKSLFSKEPIEFKDLCETKEVKTAIYLDMNENLPEGEHNRIFVGKVGLFCPINKGYGGGELVRSAGEKFDSVVGAKGYRWLESETVKELNKEDDIDKSYYEKLVNEAIASIEEYGDFETFKD